jgi:ethanolamine utilization protein EutQ (cupin superfamily)
MGAIEDAKKQAEAAVQAAMQQAQAQGGGFANMNIGAAQAESAMAKKQSADMDPNDPVFAPIEGVTYDQYVKLCVKMQPAGTDTAKQEEIAVANGLTKAQWKAVSEGMMERMKSNQNFARRLGMDVMAGGG